MDGKEGACLKYSSETLSWLSKTLQFQLSEVPADWLSTAIVSHAGRNQVLKTSKL